MESTNKKIDQFLGRPTPVISFKTPEGKIMRNIGPTLPSGAIGVERVGISDLEQPKGIIKQLAGLEAHNTCEIDKASGGAVNLSTAYSKSPFAKLYGDILNQNGDKYYENVNKNWWLHR